MKKNVLAVSIAAMIGGLGFAGMATAGTAFYATDVDPATAGAQAATVKANGKDGADLPLATQLLVTPQGVGHILLVPYFSTQDGNNSLLNIVNTDTVNGKAIKVRFRGASNSDDIYDITVLLSPGDVWAANISQENGVSKLVTNDNTCTLPADLSGDNGVFSEIRTKGAGQTLEGYVEVLNMADVPEYLALNATGAASTVKNPLYAAIKHDANGTPKCADIASQLEDLVAPTTDLTSANAEALREANEWHGRGYNYPTGGLMANWSIVNLSKAGSFTGTATAVKAATAAGDEIRAVANLVFSPQDSNLQPSDLTAIGASLHPAFLTADPLLAGGVDKGGAVVLPTIQASLYDFPDLSTPYVTDPAVQGAALAQAELLNGALATQSVTNEFFTSPVVSFATDWTFSMPARRYNVAVDYSGDSGKGRALYAAVLDYADNANAGAAPTTTPTVVDTSLPAAEQFGTFFVTGNTSYDAGKAQVCVRPGANSVNYYDTSERGASGGSYVVSPRPLGAELTFCGETSVLTFNNTDGSVLGAKIATQNIQTKQNATTTFTDGWMRINTATSTNKGLPILGHAYAKALGVATSLGGIWTHRTE